MTSPAATTVPAAPARADVAARAVDARKSYGSGDAQVHALDGVSVSFERGRFTAIMGPSGSGKSTLMHCMAGLDTLSAGHAFIDDDDISAMSERDRTLVRRDKLGFIFQSFNLIPTLTARENIVLPQKLAKTRPDEDWVDQVVTTVGLGDRLTHRPSELSGGQQQRVAVARALAGRPSMVFADEPTGNLDSSTGTEILQFMRSAVDELRQTIVMVTHDPHAASFAHRVVFLTDGDIVDDMADPTQDRVLDRMKTLGR